MSGGWSRRLLTAAAGILFVVGATSAVASSARADGRTGEVYVVHALAGRPVDVFVDGEEIGPDTAPETVLGPLDLAAGRHEIQLKDDSGAVLIASRISVKAGTSSDVVAHVKADTQLTPALTVFRNDVGPVGRGKVRLSVVHVAGAPPADILVDGEPMFRNVANGESLWLDAPAKKSQIEVVPTTGGDPIVGPVTLALKKGTLTRVFAFGEPAAGTAGAIVQELRIPVVGAARPTRVETGTGGQAAALLAGDGPSRPLSVGLALLGLALLAVSRLGVRRTVLAGVGGRHIR